MRLLNVDTFKLHDFLDDKRPPYVIASHRWLDGETTFQKVRDGEDTDAPGYKKVEAFAHFVREHTPAIKWLWVDTCCINKDSAAELSESINCMFGWYRDAAICVAFVSDVGTGDGLDAFDRSAWFKRGWTLQELLAPRLVVFVTNSWDIIGHKGNAKADCMEFVGPDLTARISVITGIAETVLHDYDASGYVSANEKMAWMTGRATTRSEDIWYALYGILDLHLGANYGERSEGAKQRLLTALGERAHVAERNAARFDRIKAWLSPPDPWTNHHTARNVHEPHTGAWLLRHEKYLDWKQGSTQVLWVHGKPGSGKTVLCSTAIEDMEKHCSRFTNDGHAIFYFTFTDTSKQTLDDLLVSLVAQLCWRGPGFEMLEKAHDRPARTRPGRDDLTRMLLASVLSFRRVYIHLDALDECPEVDRVRLVMLSGLSKFLKDASNAHVLVTSRDELGVRYAMSNLGAITLPIADSFVDSDVGLFVKNELVRDDKLRRLDNDTKELVHRTLVQKADGMFRWVYCQLLELSKSKHTGRRQVEIALKTLPDTLDATYERVLRRINPADAPRAITYLRWLSYAYRPLTLAELRETSAITAEDDPAIRDSVDEGGRSDLEDTLALLMGLIIEDAVAHADQKHDVPRGGSRLRLAHFSVKEYLESKRMLTSSAKDYHLSPARDHRLVAQSSLVYLAHLSTKFEQSSKDDEDSPPQPTDYPLVEYSAQSWHVHARAQHWRGACREIAFLSSEEKRCFWIGASPSKDSVGSRMPEARDTALCCAIIIGLEPVVDALFDTDIDVNVSSSSYGTALNAAAFLGSSGTLQSLLARGSNVNATGTMEHGSALQYAAHEGHWDIVQLLLDAGADARTRANDWRTVNWGTVLQMACQQPNAAIVRHLLISGADVRERGGFDRNTALNVACTAGHAEVVQALLEAGADVHGRAGHMRRNPLETASAAGSLEVVVHLLAVGADVHASIEQYHMNALRTASEYNHLEVVSALLHAKATVSGPKWASLLGDAYQKGQAKLVAALVDAGPDQNETKEFGTALVTASRKGDMGSVGALIKAGADPNKPGIFSNPLEVAAEHGHSMVVEALLQAGAKPDEPGRFPNALVSAAMKGHTVIVTALLNAGATIDIWSSSNRYNAIEQASRNDHIEVVDALAHRLAVDSPSIGCMAVFEWATEVGHIKIVASLLRIGPYRAMPEALTKALVSASTSNHIEIVEALIQAGADVNTPTEWAFSNALDMASLMGHVEVVEALLRAGANANGPRYDDYASPLQTSSRNGHLEIVDALLHAGAILDKGGEYMNALEEACTEGHVNVVKSLIRAGASVKARDENRTNALQTNALQINALQIAIQQGHVEVVETLLQAGADVHMHTSEQLDGLKLASSRGDVEIVDALLRAGVEVTGWEGDTANALEVACIEGHVKVVQALLSAGVNANARRDGFTSALGYACGNGHIEVVEALLLAGANVNDRPGTIDGPLSNVLQAASRGGHVRVVEALVRAGANVNMRVSNYANALEDACMGGYVEIVETLLRAGANVNERNEEYTNALTLASQAGYVKIVEALLRAGAHVNERNGNYTNALEEASRAGHLEVVGALLRAGADITSRDREYNITALEKASGEGHVEVVEALLRAGANVNERDGNCMNALEEASRAGHGEVVEALLRAGANVNEDNDEFWGALETALEAGHFVVAAVLLRAGANVSLLTRVLPMRYLCGWLYEGRLKLRARDSEREIPWECHCIKGFDDVLLEPTGKPDALLIQDDAPHLETDSDSEYTSTLASGLLEDEDWPSNSSSAASDAS
ncbi:hypothetical protein B0A48_17790 [Cryoendolithus antarcticus]|uniref:Uncharacterized protein n=1 Tax=Cryoendolithus antarcticus TaxID=1507870 RepID=A0A1V8SAI8_9PEZI|nr:hypothetical protein B0A48_17790 [Cryoendolithus antarcticus]